MFEVTEVLLAGAERVRGIVTGSRLEPLARGIYGRIRPRLIDISDRRTVAVMKKVLKHDSNCIDIGCHAGLLLREIVRLAPRGCHMAIEPLPAAAAALSREYPSVEVREVALADERGSAGFYHVVSNPGFSGLRDRPLGRPEEVAVIEVAVERLDDLVPEDRRVDFIKIDVEGAELQVLRGGARTISRWRPYMVFEHARDAAPVFGAGPDQVYDILTESGLHISTLTGWLGGRPPLSRADFALEFERGETINFLAHPRMTETP